MELYHSRSCTSELCDIVRPPMLCSILYGGVLTLQWVDEEATEQEEHEHDMTAELYSR